MRHELSPGQLVLVIAGLSGTDPRTVEKCLSGKPVRGVLVRERVELAQKQWADMVAAYEATPARREAGDHGAR